MSVTPDPVTPGATARAQARLRVVIAEDTVLLRRVLTTPAWRWLAPPGTRTSC